MAKIYGLFGAMTGKVADAVMVVRNGEQLVRKYQPVVSNPSTANQVASRAKLKLVSQLSAVLAPVIAIPRQGAVSSRNLFTKVNYKLATFADNAADIPLSDIQLTKSVIGLPPLAATREGSIVSIQLARGDSDVDRVVYAVCIKETDDTLHLIKTQVASEGGEGDVFAADINVDTGLPVTVLAYGVRDNSARARAFFGNLQVTAADVAQVVATRELSEADVNVTETRGLNVVSAE